MYNIWADEHPFSTRSQFFWDQKKQRPDLRSFTPGVDAEGRRGWKAWLQYLPLLFDDYTIYIITIQFTN